MISQKFKVGICKGCNKPKLIIHKGKGLCLTCNQKAAFERSKQRRFIKIQNGLAIDLTEVNKFYKRFWDLQTNKVCYETGVPLYRFNKWHVHHLIEKGKHPEHALNTDVCILLTLQQHALWHSLSNKSRELQMPNTYKKYIELKQKYNIK